MKLIVALAGLLASVTNAYNLDTFPLDAFVDTQHVRSDRYRIPKSASFFKKTDTIVA